MRVYNKLRKEFLEENPYCAIYAGEQATTVHHPFGRRLTKKCDLLLAKEFFIPTSLDGHVWIENHKEAARQLVWRRNDGKTIPIEAPIGKFNSMPTL